MKKLLAILTVALATSFTSVAYAGGEMKEVCSQVKDKKTGKEKEVCKKIKVHKKVEGEKVPEGTKKK
jgi:hypothetical protein